MKNHMKRRVLFVCTQNSARSLMAEALLRDVAGDRFEVASAGTEPASPHPLALQVLQEAGVPSDGLHSKSMDEFQGQYWDYVISLCEKAASECSAVSAGAQQIAWDFPDPAEENRHSVFAVTLKEIKERINLFTLVHQKETNLRVASYDPVTVFKAMADNLRLSVLLMVRDQQRLCVCELTEAFQVSQPKVSRHLALLRDAGLLATERRGQWIYYFFNQQLPDWVSRILDETALSNSGLIEQPLARLKAMADRPTVQCP